MGTAGGHYHLRASIVHTWNGHIIAHRLGLLGHEVKDYESTDARLSAASLDNLSWVLLKFCCHGVGFTATILC